MICKKYKFSFDDLAKKARIKFDWHIDPIKLGSQFLLACELKDYPRLIKPLREEQWQNFFISEAKKLKEKILGD